MDNKTHRFYLNTTSPADTVANYSRYLDYTHTPPRQLTAIDQLAINDFLTDTSNSILYLAALLPDLGYTTRQWWDYATCTHPTNPHAARLAWCLGALISHASGIDADVALTQARHQLKGLTTNYPDDLHTTNLTSLFNVATATGEPDFTTVHTLLSHALYTIYGTDLTDAGILTPDDLAHRIITTTATDLDGELAHLTDGTFTSQPTDTADDSTLDAPLVTATPAAPPLTITDEAHLTPATVHTHRMLYTNACNLIDNLDTTDDGDDNALLRGVIADKLTDIIILEPILMALMAHGVLHHRHLRFLYDQLPESSAYRDYLACTAFVHATSNHHHLHYGDHTLKDELSDDDYAVLEAKIHTSLADSSSMLRERAVILKNTIEPPLEPDTITANWAGHMTVVSEIVTAITDNVETRTGDAENSMMALARILHPYNNSSLSIAVTMVTTSMLLHMTDSPTQAVDDLIDHDCLNTDTFVFIGAMIADLIGGDAAESARAYRVLHTIDSDEPERIFIKMSH